MIRTAAKSDVNAGNPGTQNLRQEDAKFQADRPRIQSTLSQTFSFSGIDLTMFFLSNPASIRTSNWF